MKITYKTLKENFKIGIEVIRREGFYNFLKVFLLFIERILGLTKNKLMDNNDPISIIRRKQTLLQPTKKEVNEKIKSIPLKPQFLIIIELDGIQHFEPVEFFGGEEGFKSLQERDAIKTNYCKENNIDLIRIPYWEEKNIKSILTSELGDNNYNELEKFFNDFIKEFPVGTKFYSEKTLNSMC